MTHYRLNDSMPSAIVLSRNSRSSSLDESRIYQDNTIFLEDRQEFAIRLFNPLGEKIGVRVGLNNKFSDSLLVMHPGEVATLDRFVDEQKRMIFETYMYDKNNESSKKAVEKNGIVEIRFYKEKTSYMYSTAYTNWETSWDLDITNSPYISPGVTTTESDSSITININDVDANITIGKNAGYSGKKSSKKLKGNIIKGKQMSGTGSRLPHFTNSSAANQLWEPITVKNRNSRVYSTMYNVQGMGSVANPSLEETGRVEKGSKSDQDFHQVDNQFETYHFHSTIFYLKPVSKKSSYEVEVREYCPTCKYRVRNRKWNYCPKCGEDLSQI